MKRSCYHFSDVSSQGTKLGLSGRSMAESRLDSGGALLQVTVELGSALLPLNSAAISSRLHSFIRFPSTMKVQGCRINFELCSKIGDIFCSPFLPPAERCKQYSNKIVLSHRFLNLFYFMMWPIHNGHWVLLSLHYPNGHRLTKHKLLLPLRFEKRRGLRI